MPRQRYPLASASLAPLDTGRLFNVRRTLCARPLCSPTTKRSATELSHYPLVHSICKAIAAHRPRHSPGDCYPGYTPLRPPLPALGLGHLQFCTDVRALRTDLGRPHTPQRINRCHTLGCIPICLYRRKAPPGPIPVQDYPMFMIRECPLVMDKLRSRTSPWCCASTSRYCFCG